MRLTKHRADVRLLRESWASHGGSPVFVDIARRYLRLIRMAEQALDFHDLMDVEETREEKRVLKDAGGK